VNGHAQGPPKSAKEYQQATLRRDLSLHRSGRSQAGSFLLGQWLNNSCAYDAALYALYAACRLSPSLLPAQHELVEPRTRAEASSLSHVRARLWCIVQQLCMQWSGEALHTKDELTRIRDEFRHLMYPLMGMTERRGTREMIAADRAARHT